MKYLDKLTILKKNSGRAKCIAGPTSLKSGGAMARRAIPIAHSMVRIPRKAKFVFNNLFYRM